MEGLRNVYYNPEVFGVLPYRHSYTQTGDVTISAFFLPAFKTIKETNLLDKRGWISDEDGKKYFDRIRALKTADPKELVTYCAEFCYNAEEAFSLEGDNKFNKINIAE
jgi:glycyl-tRNA synthetase alpha subunit